MPSSCGPAESSSGFCCDSCSQPPPSTPQCPAPGGSHGGLCEPCWEEPGDVHPQPGRLCWGGGALAGKRGQSGQRKTLVGRAAQEGSTRGAGAVWPPHDSSLQDLVHPSLARAFLSAGKWPPRPSSPQVGSARGWRGCAPTVWAAARAAPLTMEGGAPPSGQSGELSAGTFRPQVPAESPAMPAGAPSPSPAGCAQGTPPLHSSCGAPRRPSLGSGRQTGFLQHAPPHVPPESSEKRGRSCSVQGPRGPRSRVLWGVRLPRRPRTGTRKWACVVGRASASPSRDTGPPACHLHTHRPVCIRIY